MKITKAKLELEQKKLEIQEKKIELAERKINLKNLNSEIPLNYIKVNLDIASELRSALSSSYLISQKGSDIEAEALFDKKEYDTILKKYYDIIMML